jgi:SAM-dependent methyltransferase
MSKSFNLYSAYYDLLYADKDYASECKYVDELIKSHVHGPSSILELGSGTGIHGTMLADAGYLVRGIEKSPEMVARSRTHQNFSCEVGDIVDFVVDSKYDVALSLFHVVSYVTSNEDLASLFSGVFNHLKSEGLFIFDFWFTPAVLSESPSVRVKRMSNSTWDILRIAEPEADHILNTVDVKYSIFVTDRSTNTIHSFEEHHKMRHFSLPEINIFAENAGFKMIHAEEFMSKSAPSDLTWGVMVVLQKAIA